jgi:hypothetical protein
VSRRESNKRHIEKYVVFFDRLFPSAVGFINVEIMDNKPESTPPIPDRAWEYLEDGDNRQTALLLAPIFQQMRQEQPPLYLIVGLVAGFIKPLQDEEADHGALRRWRARETGQDGNRAELFERAVSWLEEKFNDKHPQLWIKVSIPKKDDPLQGLVHQRNIDNNALRSWDARESYRRIDADIKLIIQEEECTVEAAIGLYRDRLERANEPNVCVRKIWMARAFVKEEEAIKAIAKEKNCSWEFAIDLYELRKQGQSGGAA